MPTYTYQQATPKETAPRVFSVIGMVDIQKNGPLISADQDFATAEVLSRPVLSCQDCGCQKMKAYSASCQSNPAGQSSDPVSSWLNPRLIFEFLCKGGWIAAPFGEIQSSIADFNDLVSSPLAPDAPLPILKL